MSHPSLMITRLRQEVEAKPSYFLNSETSRTFHGMWRKQELPFGNQPLWVNNQPSVGGQLVAADIWLRSAILRNTASPSLKKSFAFDNTGTVRWNIPFSKQARRAGEENSGAKQGNRTVDGEMSGMALPNANPLPHPSPTGILDGLEDPSIALKVPQ